MAGSPRVPCTSARRPSMWGVGASPPDHIILPRDWGRSMPDASTQTIARRRRRPLEAVPRARCTLPDRPMLRLSRARRQAAETRPTPCFRSRSSARAGRQPPVRVGPRWSRPGAGGPTACMRPAAASCRPAGRSGRYESRRVVTVGPSCLPRPPPAPTSRLVLGGTAQALAGGNGR